MCDEKFVISKQTTQINGPCICLHWRDYNGRTRAIPTPTMVLRVGILTVSARLRGLQAYQAFMGDRTRYGKMRQVFLISWGRQPTVHTGMSCFSAGIAPTLRSLRSEPP